MTFNQFTAIVNAKYPNAKMYMHGKMAGNKINVAIVFNGTNEEKVYQYNGTYCEVLNKLGIKAMYQHNYDAVKDHLAKAKALHETEDEFFGFTYDKSEEIKELTSLLNEIERDFIIV